MLAKTLPNVRSCQVPADCYNLSRLIQRLVGGSVELGLTDLSDNRVLLSTRHWSCWNRKLDAVLLSWDDFRPMHRSGLDDPVACTLTVHHPYSRTIIHHVYHGLTKRLRWELSCRQPVQTGRVIAWPGGCE